MNVESGQRGFPGCARKNSLALFLFFPVSFFRSQTYLLNLHLVEDFLQHLVVTNAVVLGLGVELDLVHWNDSGVQGVHQLARDGAGAYLPVRGTTDRGSEEGKGKRSRLSVRAA